MASKTNTAENLESSTPAKTNPKKIGLERFLQLVPQDRGVMALLRSKYAMDVKTQEDWEMTVKNLLERNAK